MKKRSSIRINRRQFLQRTGAGVALFNILPGNFLHGAQPLSPNEKLEVVGIGIGNQGGRDVDEVAGLGHNIVALCDVDENYAAKAIRQISQGETLHRLSCDARQDGQGDRRGGHRHARSHARGHCHGGHAARQACLLRKAAGAHCP